MLYGCLECLRKIQWDCIIERPCGRRAAEHRIDILAGVVIIEFAMSKRVLLDRMAVAHA